MRVGYLATRYPAVSHAFILREVEALRAVGVEVHTFAIHRSGPEDQLTEADRRAARTTYAVRPLRWPGFILDHLLALAVAPRRYLGALAFALRLPAVGGGRRRQVFYFAEAVPIWRRCRRLGLRHLHGHFTSPSSDVAMLVARVGGPDADWSWSFTAHGTDIFTDRPERLAEKVRRAAFVVCVSDFGRSQLMSLSCDGQWSKLHVVRSGLDLDRFAVPQRAAAGTLQVLTVGRAHPVKGQAILIDALAELAGRGVEVEATIVGDGPRLDALRARARARGVGERVHFAGRLGQDRLLGRYAQADVFCLPSFGEGIPVVLLEAMAMGLPVVATRVMGVPELVEDGRTGLLVTPGRADELADGLARLAADPQLRCRLAAAGRAKVAAEHDLAGSARRLQELFARQAGARAAR